MTALLQSVGVAISRREIQRRLTAWFTDPSWRANEGWAAVEAQAEALWPTVPP